VIVYKDCQFYSFGDSMPSAYGALCRWFGESFSNDFHCEHCKFYTEEVSDEELINDIHSYDDFAFKEGT